MFAIIGKKYVSSKESIFNFWQKYQFNLDLICDLSHSKFLFHSCSINKSYIWH